MHYNLTKATKSIPAVVSCVYQPSTVSNLKNACNYVRKLRGETPWQLASSHWRLATTMNDGETTTNDEWRLVALLLSFMSSEATLAPPPNPSGWYQRLLKLHRPPLKEHHFGVGGCNWRNLSPWTVRTGQNRFYRITTVCHRRRPLFWWVGTTSIRGL